MTNIYSNRIKTLSYLPAFLSCWSKSCWRWKYFFTSIPVTRLAEQSLYVSHAHTPPQGPALGYVAVISKCSSDLGSKWVMCTVLLGTKSTICFFLPKSCGCNMKGSYLPALLNYYSFWLTVRMLWKFSLRESLYCSSLFCLFGFEVLENWKLLRLECHNSQVIYADSCAINPFSLSQSLRAVNSACGRARKGIVVGWGGSFGGWEHPPSVLQSPKLSVPYLHQLPFFCCQLPAPISLEIPKLL